MVRERMSGMPPKHMSPGEIKKVHRIRATVADKLPAGHLADMNNYVTMVERENDNHTLHLHNNDEWINGFHCRNGSSTVFGTMVEFMVCACVHSTGGVWVFDHTELNQKTHHVDGTVNGINASVKKISHQPRLGGIRLGADYFPPNSTAELLIFGDVDTLDVYIIDYDAAREYFMQYRDTTKDNHYCYRPVDDILKQTGGKRHKLGTY